MRSPGVVVLAACAVLSTVGAMAVRSQLPAAPVLRILVGGGSLAGLYGLTLILFARRQVGSLWRELSETRLGV